MRKRSIAAFLVLSLAGFVSGCASLKVAADHDPSVDFSALKSFSWLPEKPYLLERFPELTKQLHEDVDGILSGKGFRALPPGSEADFHLRYDAALDTKLNIQQINDAYGYTSGPWRYEYNPNPLYGGYSRPYEWDKGTLIIDVTDRSGKRLIWRGVAVAHLDEYDSPSDRAEIVRRAIRRIMEAFPP